MMNNEQDVQKESVPVQMEPTEKKRRVIVTQEMKLNQYRDVIENTFADPYIQEMAAKYGYDNQRLLEGKSLMERTVNLYEGFKNKEKNQILKYKEFAEIWKQARKTYHRFIKTARLAFDGNKELLDRIGVKFIKAAPFGVGVAQAKLFYNNLEQMPEILSEMGKYNVSPQEIQEGKNQVLNAEVAKSQHNNAVAETQQASALKALEFKKLSTWIADYRKVMRVALKSDGQLLEKLGIRVPSPI
ncbi:MAG: hypothetical protein JSV88_08665 [Candidatus Aminicenantes bacterium]|nr:MAG: hypothetical protein JSV88_08665 [Candidatus Aminicenantes bacterium]